MNLPIKLPPERVEFIKSNLEKGHTPTVVSRAYQRRFGAVLRPQDIENLRASLYTPEKIQQQRNVDDIRSKLPSHDRQLEFARALLEERMKDPDVTNNELVNLAREYRSNITASQQIASMTAEKGDTQFVLVYGNAVQAASQGADIEEAEFKLLEDDE